MILTFATPKFESPFRHWVPNWLQITVAVIILLPVMMINGAYIGSNVDVSSYLGVISEDINMAFYSCSVGMAVAYLIVPRVKKVMNTKTIIIMDLLFQVFFSFICARTNYIEVIIFCSFFIGYFKAFTMRETIFLLMKPFSPSNTRNEFYAKFYPITLTCSQLSYALTAVVAYNFNWQYMYYLMIIMLLVAIFAVIICMKSFNFKGVIDIPYKTIDWVSFFLISVCWICIIYVTTYGKTLDWFNSTNIIIRVLLIPVTGWLFIHRQFRDDPLLDMSILKNRNSTTVYVLSFVLMFYASFSNLVSTYILNVLRLDSGHVNRLYMYSVPGFIVGGFICYYWYKKELRMAWLIFLGFACFTLSLAILYFRISPRGLYSDMFLLMFLRGVGMLVLFVAFGIYVIYGLEPRQMPYNSFFLISSRSVLAPAVASSILTNWMYRLQQRNITYLSQNVDMQNDLATGSFSSSLRNALAQGLNFDDARRLATNSIYQTVQIQATAVSVKTIAGWMLIFGIVLLVVIILYFLRFTPVRIMMIGRDLTE